MVLRLRGGMLHESSGRDGSGNIICAGFMSYCMGYEKKHCTALNCPWNEVVYFRANGNAKGLAFATARLTFTECEKKLKSLPSGRSDTAEFRDANQAYSIARAAVEAARAAYDQCEPSAPVASSVVDGSPRLAALMRMGFSREGSLAALQRTGGVMERAVDLLLRDGGACVTAPPDALDPFTCAICLDTCIEPATAGCGAHNFCADHLREWVAAKAPAPTCPVCWKPIQKKPADIMVNVGIRDVIEARRQQAIATMAVAAAAADAASSSSAAADADAAPSATAASASSSASSSAAAAATAPSSSSVAVIPYDSIVFELNRRGHRVELGRGAYSSVYAATYHGEAVAVKVFLVPHGAEAAVEAVFWREVRVQYHARHEGVLQLYRAAVDRDAPGAPPQELALVMPRMAANLEVSIAGCGGGGSAPAAAATASSAGSAAPSRTVLRDRLILLREVAGALRFLHARGIVHGDLKPANVLVNAVGKGARVADFGHARLRREGGKASMSVGGGGLGTPRYSDPAVSSGGNALRKASDLYSFGILAWQVLAGGALPFAGLELAPLLKHVQEGGRPPLGALQLEALPVAVRTQVGALLSKCWAAGQAARPTQVCDALDGLVQQSS